MEENLDGNLKKTLRDTAEGLANILSAILLLAVGLSFLARVHWLADIFSHFLIQYIIGAVVLGSFYAMIRTWPMAGLMALILFVSLHEIRRPVTPSSNVVPAISVMQYNRLIAQTNHDVLIEFITKTHPADIIVIQEAGAEMGKVIDHVKDIYPYYINETRSHAFGMVILTRYPITDRKFIPLPGPILDNFLLRASIDIPGSEENLVLYALHAVPPTDNIPWAQRNSELQRASTYVAQDNSPYIIMAGDWNITPYSPFFQDFLTATRLNYQETQLYPPVTWPSTFRLPVFQVGIDHILSSDSLKLIRKETGSPMSSDHYPLIATFGLASP
ncbi:MAG: endonuclease/exonuclease/phosphatase family protein [Micavibrio aeruginosavorus]|uniref:Endonuclease/exonuclease/phosphatase family protein n=1 Tax=Micavibrio aeruginosavorus TaxID=349221 RepID=A0A7T5R1S1_9BACT|nr:MAG: endonuclease/exonuclease/phosphatase family protein [Micavibrio aeruginosavorus]